MSPTLELLLQFVAELLKNCPEPEEQKAQFLKSPGLIRRLRLRNHALDNGMSLAEFREGMNELEKLRSEATDDDFRAFVRTSCKAA